jgi:hypothetical protein
MITAITIIFKRIYAKSSQGLRDGNATQHTDMVGLYCRPDKLSTPHLTYNIKLIAPQVKYLIYAVYIFAPMPYNERYNKLLNGREVSICGAMAFRKTFTRVTSPPLMR